MTLWGGKKPYDHEREEAPTHHFSFDLTPKQREQLLDLLEHDKRPSIADRRYLAERIRNARRRSGPPLPDATIDWESAEREANERGGTVIDLIFDRAHAPEPPDKAA